MSHHVAQITLEAVPEFIRQMEETRNELTPEDWREFVSSSSEIRRWRYFLCQDPYTRWGLLKPRGYAGDARVMDFAYRHPSIHPEIRQSGETGQEIYAYTSGFVQSKSLRQRIEFVAHHLNAFIDNRSARAPKITVASYGSGHGRELERLELDTLRAIDCFYAIDTDADALIEIQKNQGVLHLKAVQQSVFQFQPEVYQFDFVYSLGLFDSLKTEQARLLLEKMYTALRPGGRLLLDHLDPDTPNIAYCEAVMDWWRMYKSKDEMRALSSQLPGSSAADHIHIEKMGGIHYLLIEKGDGYIWA